MKKFIRSFLWTVFILYSYVVFSLLLFGRGIVTDESVWKHIATTTNLIPFKTIGQFVRQYIDGFLRGVAIRNLGGNFFLLFPIGILLPCLFPRCNRLWKVTLGMTAFILLAEAIQGFLRIGFIDIDDILLNVVGGVAGYGLIAIPPIKRWLMKVGILQEY